MLDGKLDLRQQNVDVGALIQTVLEELGHVEQPGRVTAVLNQAVNILLHERLDAALAERRVLIVAHVPLELRANLELVKRHD